MAKDSEVVAGLREVLIPYRNNQRMGEAEFSWKVYRMLCQLLMLPTGMMTARQQDSIALALVGFNSETNFISTFSSRVGIPPQRFREFPL